MSVERIISVLQKKKKNRKWQRGEVKRKLEEQAKEKEIPSQDSFDWKLYTHHNYVAIN